MNRHISFVLILALGCAGSEFNDEDLATNSSNLLVTEPQCNDVFNFALNPPPGQIGLSSMSYQNRGWLVQGTAGPTEIRNGLHINAQGPSVDARGVSVDEIDVQFFKRYAPINNSQYQQIASQVFLRVYAPNGNTMSVFSFIPDSCEVLFGRATVTGRDTTGQMFMMTFYSQFGGGG